jgi:hypothetical protein
MGQSDRSVALVTGGASGIGLATVRRFLAGGLRVTFVATSTEHAERALDLLGKHRDRLFAETIDVTRHGDIAGFIDRVRRRWDEIAILVNNAAISPKRKSPDAPWFAQTSLDEWALRHRRQSQRSLHPHQPPGTGDDRPWSRTHHSYRIDGGPGHALDRGAALCGVQSRAGRLDEGRRTGSRTPRHNGQLHRSRPHSLAT